MKTKQIKLLVLLLAIAMLLSGCNLIGTDYKLKADKEIEKLAETYEQSVAQYEGGTLTLRQCVRDFNSNYSMYQAYGIEMTHEDVHEMIQDTLESAVRSAVVGLKFDETMTLTDEELQEIEAEARAIYDDNILYAAEEAAGESKEERNENARVLLYINGLDVDSVVRLLALEKKNEKMEQSLRDEISAVSDEQLQIEYDSRVETQKSYYANGFGFESAYGRDSELIFYQPEGYRAVKHILLMPSEESKQAYSDAKLALSSAEASIQENERKLAEGDGDADELQAQLDASKLERDQAQSSLDAAIEACLADVKETSDAIYAALESGEDFESLMDSYGEDPGMQNEPTRSAGYAVSSISQQWDTNFRDGAMALENVGDYSAQPVVGSSGAHIIYYFKDIESGAVALDQLREPLSEQLLETMKYDHVEESINAWIEAANPVYDVEHFESLL